MQRNLVPTSNTRVLQNVLANISVHLEDAVSGFCLGSSI